MSALTVSNEVHERGGENKVRRFGEIVDRIEKVRIDLGLNKSRFSTAIGMKPQTYNNFIGAQASKPNVELLYGMVTKFGVNPTWILTGSGNMFLANPMQSPMGGGLGRNVGSSSQREAQHGTPELELSRKIEELRPTIERIEALLATFDQQHESLLDRVNIVLRHYVLSNPTDSIADITEFLEHVERRI